MSRVRISCWLIPITWFLWDVYLYLLFFRSLHNFHVLFTPWLIVLLSRSFEGWWFIDRSVYSRKAFSVTHCVRLQVRTVNGVGGDLGGGIYNATMVVSDGTVDVGVVSSMKFVVCVLVHKQVGLVPWLSDDILIVFTHSGKVISYLMCPGIRGTTSHLCISHL